jgi:hypothetical protein
LLDFPLEAAKGVLQRFALLKLYFSQIELHLPTRPEFPCVDRSFQRPCQFRRQTGATPKNPARHTEGTDIIGGCQIKSSPIFRRIPAPLPRTTSIPFLFRNLAKWKMYLRSCWRGARENV